jgi:MFS family permease
VSNSHTFQHYKKGLRILANAFYFLCLFFIVVFLILGIWASANFNTKEGVLINEYGGAIHKYPLTNHYILTATSGSLLGEGMSEDGLIYSRLYAINGCNTEEFDSIKTLFACAKVGQTERIDLEIDKWGERRKYRVYKDPTASPFKLDVAHMSIDSVLLLLSLGLSLLLFAKGRRYISGYFISLALLTNVCESRFFYLGSSIASAADAEAIRLSIAFIVGPLALYFFPKTFDKKFWRRTQLSLIILCIVLLLFCYHFLLNLADGLQYFLYAVSFTLLVIIVQFIFKYRLVLNTKEQKQVLTMLFCVALGLVLYFPLMNLNYLGFLIGRYIIMLSVGFGVFFALMRYGLWQVDSIISKSATLSLLSVVAFSFWAGLDQGMQALLNQTIGLSNTTLTAFLAAAISSLFAIPAYNYISKSCDAFFNKDLHQLKRFLSKDILVLAETQQLSFFVDELGAKLLKLSGAHKIDLEFHDYNRLPEPIKFHAQRDVKTNEYLIKKEIFEYKIKNILSLYIEFEYIDRRINREIKREFEDGTDEIARALASCARWNYLESLDPAKKSLRPIPM